MADARRSGTARDRSRSGIARSVALNPFAASAGDRVPLVRDPVDLLRLALLIGVPITLAIGPRNQSFRLLLTFLLVLIPRALDAPRPFDLAFTVAMSFQAWGNVFGAFEHIYGYDKIVHFFLPLSASAIAYLTLVRFDVVPDLVDAKGLHSRPATVLLTAALGLAFMGGLYELYEWFADTALGAHLFTDYGDTIGDLTDDLLGALCGGFFVLLWKERGWPTRRADISRRGDPDDPLAELGDTAVARLEPGRDLPDPGPEGAATRFLLGELPADLRNPLDLGRLSLLVGLAIALPGTEWDSAVRFTIGFAAAWAVRALELPRFFDALFLLAVSLEAWGAFGGAFINVSGFDSTIHVVATAAAAPVIYVAFVRRELLPELSRRAGLHQSTALGLSVFAFGFSIGILYEIYAYLANHLLDASIAAGYDVLIGRLALDALGALIGAALVVAWGAVGLPFRAPARQP